MVREYSALRYESFMGQGIPLSLLLMRGVTANHGLNKVSGGSGVLNCPRLSGKSLEQSRLNWTVLGGSRHNWSLLRCPVMPQDMHLLSCGLFVHRDPPFGAGDPLN